jgi:hypothetical protein
MERRWLALAKNFEFSRRLGDFSNEAKRHGTSAPPPGKTER